MFSSFTVVFDACVLYPAHLRDLLISLAGTGMFRARWTDRIHDEWIRAVLKDNPGLDRTILERTRELMNRAVLGCLVTGYEHLIEGLTLPDPDDRHVLAAAIRAGASAIVTTNLRDFPADRVGPYGVEAMHPDTFVSLQIELCPDLAIEAIREQRARLRKPPMSADAFVRVLERHLPRTASLLRSQLEAL